MLNALPMIARSHMVERPVRTAMTVLGIALGVAVFVAIRTANVEVLKSFEEAVTTVAGRSTLQVSGGELGLDERVMVALQRQPGVVSASPVVQQQAQVAGGPHRGKALVVMGLDLLEAADYRNFRLRTGAGAEPTLDPLLEPNALFIGARLAAELSLSAGSQMELLVGTRIHRVVVRGVVESSTGIRTAWEHLAVMDIAAAQALFGSIGKLDRIDLITDPARPVEEVADTIRPRLPPPLTIRRPAHRGEQVERMVRAFQLNLATLSGSACWSACCWSTTRLPIRWSGIAARSGFCARWASRVPGSPHSSSARRPPWGWSAERLEASSAFCWPGSLFRCSVGRSPISTRLSA